MGRVNHRALRRTLSSLVEARARHDVDFSLDGVHIGGTVYSLETLDLLSKSKAEAGLAVYIKCLSAGLEARYDPSTNTFMPAKMPALDPGEFGDKMLAHPLSILPIVPSTLDHPR